jgi:hypothetical protein
MKRLITLLLVILVAGTTLHAEKGIKSKKQKNIPPHRREMMEQRAELEMEAEEQEFHRENRYANLELQKQEMELQHQRKMRDMQRQMESLKVQAKKQALQKDSKKPACTNCSKKGGRKDWKKKHGWMMWKMCMVMKIIIVVVNILLAVWVYQDIRKRNSGSGIWIVLSLLTGFFGALLYLLARIGDSKAPTQS